jgi:hypothetical protein
MEGNLDWFQGLPATQFEPRAKKGLGMAPLPSFFTLSLSLFTFYVVTSSVLRFVQIHIIKPAPAAGQLLLASIIANGGCAKE